jgi:predicted RNase H-like HicB family nuclease
VLADVSELPGCFAAGNTLGELFESLQEGIALRLTDETSFHGDAEAWQRSPLSSIDLPKHDRSW